MDEGASGRRLEGWKGMSEKARRAGGGEWQRDDALLPSPADCMRSRTGRKCDRCGTVAAVSHVPTRIAGVFCPFCCPACNPQPKSEGDR